MRLDARSIMTARHAREQKHLSAPTPTTLSPHTAHWLSLPTRALDAASQPSLWSRWPSLPAAGSKVDET